MLSECYSGDAGCGISIAEIRASKTIPQETLRHFFIRDPKKLPKAENMASELCLSVRTFSRYLKNAGVNYREMQEQFRKTQAAYYLLETDESIKNIAEQMGYANSSNFTKAFKVWFGVTPKVYRARG